MSSTSIELQPVATIASEAGSLDAPAASGTNRNGEIVPEQYPSGFRLVTLLVGLVLSILLVALDSAILATAIPRITEEFGTVKDVGWYSSAYSISNAAFITSWGKGYKHFPLKCTFAAAVVTFELGNAICALAPNSATLVLGRIVSGVGGGGSMTGCFITIALSAKPHLRSAYMGVLGLTFGAASVVGPLLGGFLTDGPGWRWCFWISLPLGAFAALVLTLSVRVPAASRPVQCSIKEKIYSLDLVGGFFVLASMALLVLALEHAGVTASWRSWRVVLSLCGCGILAALFVINEKLMGSRAMIQSHILKKRNIAANLAYMFFLSGLYFPLSYTLPIQFQSVDNVSATGSGLRLIPLILGVCVFTMIVNGVLTFWRRHFMPFLLVGAIVGTIGAVLIHTIGPDARVRLWIIYELIVGLGVGIALQVPMIANQAAVGVDDIAAITSLTLFFENMGTAIFVAATESAFTNGLVNALARNTPSVSPESVVNTGATGLRTAFSSNELAAILHSYLEGCKDSILVPISCGAIAVLISFTVSVPAVTRQVSARLRKRT